MKNKLLFLLVFCLIFSITHPVYGQDNPAYPVYVVQSGDTLGQIAALLGVSQDELILLNNISDPNSIYPGLSLLIPGLQGISGTIESVHVNLGETWSDFLLHYQADSNTVVKINHLLSPTQIYPGANLLVPVRSDIPEIEPKGLVNENQTLLENAVQINSNPFSLLLQNRKAAPFDFFSNDLVYSKNTNLKTVNAFSSLIETASLSPLPLVQGDTVVVHIVSSVPLTLEGHLAEYQLKFYSPDNVNYYALQGIHAMASPGLVDFSLTGTGLEGPSFTLQEKVLLEPGYFETDDPLTVDPAMIDPAVTAPELAKIEEITSGFTTPQYWEGIFLSPDTDYATEIPNYEQVKEITSYFGSRRTYNDDPQVTFHTGIDFGGGSGLPIVACAAGKVVFAGALDVRGNATIIDHGLGVYSAYYHQQEILVNVGEMVEKGQKIGLVGNSGRVDRANEYEGAGSHLHWELWVNGVQVNPFDWVNSEYP